MSNNTNNNTNRQFLDYKGLETLWNNIKTTFPYRTESIADIGFVADTYDDVYLKYTRADGDNSSKNIRIPVASGNNAGIITAGTYNTIVSLQGGSADLVPITGVKIDSKKTSLNDRFANIKLDYTTKTDEKGVTRSYLSLIDANFVGDAHWETTTESDYNKETNGGSGSNKNYAKVKQSDDSYLYYKWNGGKYECPPAYDNERPVLVTPISTIDVTEFVKSGMLESATYDSTNLEIRFVFHTYNYETKEFGKTEFTIPVGDFIDEYQEGEGIIITSDVSYGDHEKNISVISLDDAETDKLGGIKVAKDNAVAVKTLTSSIESDVTEDTQNNSRYIGVETDKNDKAFVYVPWMNAAVSEEDYNVKHGLILSQNNDTLTNTISLGVNTIASLEKADTAIQSLSILDYELGHNKNKQYTITKADAISALDLKSASHVDTIDKIDATTDGDSQLPTRGAVKKYVGTEINTFKESLDSYIDASDFTIVRTGYDAGDPYLNHVGYKVFNKIEIKDGFIQKGNDYQRALSIYDIHDFAPLTADDINEICTIN